MKTPFYIAGFFLFFLSQTSISQQRPDKNLDIYIMMGQSNMAGRGVITPRYSKLQHDRVVMLNKENEWVKAIHPVHFDKPKSAGVGPALSFGIAMAEAYPDRKIALVPCAVGGTPIKKWIPGAYDAVTKTHPYDDAVKRIKHAMKYGTIKGIIWHQGEGDSKLKESQQYIANLTELINRVRHEVSDPQLPFMVGELGRYRKTYYNINNVLPHLSSKVSNTQIVSSEGLWHKGDGTHFDSPSAAEFGRRYAEAMLEVQGKSVVTKKEKLKSVLSKKEIKDGWELLFDGQNANKRWRGINSDKFPDQGWAVEKGTLVLLPGRKGGDIISREEFSDFELVLEYKLADSANTGIKYLVSPLKDGKGKIQLNGPEFQLIDDFKHESVKDNKSPETSTASVYLLYAPQGKKLKKPGKWNKIKIIAKGNNVEHWINGKKVVAYKRGSGEFRKLVSNTKFKEYQTLYGEAKAGYILIQDHKDQAWFKNIKVRRME